MAHSSHSLTMTAASGSIYTIICVIHAHTNVPPVSTHLNSVYSVHKDGINMGGNVSKIKLCPSNLLSALRSLSSHHSLTHLSHPSYLQDSNLLNMISSRIYYPHNIREQLRL